jgi:hypothetical protein
MRIIKLFLGRPGEDILMTSFSMLALNFLADGDASTQFLALNLTHNLIKKLLYHNVKGKGKHTFSMSCSWCLNYLVQCTLLRNN